MYNYVLFWISYLLSALQRFWILKRFFCDTWSRTCKTRSESRETNNNHPSPPYVGNNYRMEVKITVMLIAYLVLLCEFFWEFSFFHFCRPQVDIYQLLRCSLLCGRQIACSVWELGFFFRVKVFVLHTLTLSNTQHVNVWMVCLVRLF